MVDQRRIDDQRWVAAARAAAHLGIARRSLYAYVSRGLVASMPGARGRPRLYALADVERLRVRRDARKGHGAVAAGALRWGEPVLDSAITAITRRGPAYHGRLGLELAAAGVSFERVAELLWSGQLPADEVCWPEAREPWRRGARRLAAGAHPLDALALVVALAAVADPTRGDGRPDAFIACGRRILPLLARGLAFAAAPSVTPRAGARGARAAPVRARRAKDGESCARIAARALGLDAAAVPVLDAALVLLADHELNASSFAARVAASTGADAYACTAAALATVSGPRHGTAAEGVAAFADEMAHARHVPARVAELRRAGRVPPGFGHPLYPDGDARAAPLLAAAAAALARAPRTAARHAQRAQTLLALARAVPDAHPNVDLALAALVAALGAPATAASALFALARSAGWLAHALEQRAAGYLLRPRARYVGRALEPYVPGVS